MLTLNTITCQYSENVVFKDLSFSVYDRACMLIKGKNGSGKTSLLKSIAGLKKLTSGEILINGTEISTLRKEGYQTSYLGHELGINNNLSVIDNLGFFAKLNGMELALRAAISYFQLNDIADVKAAKLSAGLKKRLSLSYLLLSPAHLWLLDEPDANLDEASKIRLQNLIDQKLSNGGTILLTSHSSDKMQATSIINMEDF